MKKTNAKLVWLIVILLGFNLNSSAQLTLQDSLVAYYPFNGNANDESGIGNDATLMGATLTTDRFGNANTAFDFNGAGDYIDIPNSADLKPNFPFTISLWAKLGSLDPYSVLPLYASDESTTGYAGYAISIVSPGQVQAFYGDGTGYGSTDRISKMSDSIIADTTNWFNIVAIFNGLNDIDLYINSQIDSGYYTGSGSSMVYSSFNSKIGRDKYSSGIQYHNGKIDDIRIYNRPLANTEIDSIYIQQPVSIKDLSMKESDIEIYPNPTLGNLNISWDMPDEEQVLVRIWGMDGKEIHYATISQNAKYVHQVELGEFARGLYFVQIITSDQVLVKKLVLR